MRVLHVMYCRQIGNCINDDQKFLNLILAATMPSMGVTPPWYSSRELQQVTTLLITGAYPYTVCGATLTAGPVSRVKKWLVTCQLYLTHMWASLHCTSDVCGIGEPASDVDSHWQQRSTVAVYLRVKCTQTLVQQRRTDTCTATKA